MNYETKITKPPILFYICNGKIPTCTKESCFYLHNDLYGYCKYTSQMNYSKTLEETGDLPNKFERVKGMTTKTHTLYREVEPENMEPGAYVGLKRGPYYERKINSNYYCGRCGWKVTDHDSFCPECGGALHKRSSDD